MSAAVSLPAHRLQGLAPGAGRFAGVLRAALQEGSAGRKVAVPALQAAAGAPGGDAQGARRAGKPGCWTGAPLAPGCTTCLPTKVGGRG